jgi:hypothetical protein
MSFAVIDGEIAVTTLDPPVRGTDTTLGPASERELYLSLPFFMAYRARSHYH